MVVNEYVLALQESRKIPGFLLIRKSTRPVTAIELPRDRITIRDFRSGTFMSSKPLPQLADRIDVDGFDSSRRHRPFSDPTMKHDQEDARSHQCSTQEQ